MASSTAISALRGQARPIQHVPSMRPQGPPVLPSPRSCKHCFCCMCLVRFIPCHGSFLDRVPPNDCVFVGEVGLRGELRPVSEGGEGSMLPLTAYTHGIKLCSSLPLRVSHPFVCTWVLPCLTAHAASIAGRSARAPSERGGQARVPCMLRAPANPHRRLQPPAGAVVRREGRERLLGGSLQYNPRGATGSWVEELLGLMCWHWSQSMDDTSNGTCRKLVEKDVRGYSHGQRVAVA